MGFKDVLIGICLMAVGGFLVYFAMMMFAFAPLSGNGGSSALAIILGIFGAALVIYGQNKARRG